MAENQLNVRLEKELKNLVEQKSDSEYRSQNSVIQEAVQRYFSGDLDE